MQLEPNNTDDDKDDANDNDDKNDDNDDNDDNDQVARPSGMPEQNTKDKQDVGAARRHWINGNPLHQRQFFVVNYNYS